MTKHTPGPWYVGTMYGYGNSTCILRRPPCDYGEQGVIGDAPIAKMIERASHWENSYPVAENARRIVACVNACDGIPTALLERHGVDGVVFGSKQWMKRLYDQNVRLISALQSLADCYERKSDAKEPLIFARQEIARATGETK